MTRINASFTTFSSNIVSTGATNLIIHLRREETLLGTTNWSTAHQSQEHLLSGISCTTAIPSSHFHGPSLLLVGCQEGSVEVALQEEEEEETTHRGSVKSWRELSSLPLSLSVTLLWCLPWIDWMCKHWSGDSLNFLIWGLGNRRRTEWKRIWCCWAVSEPQPGIDQLTVVATKSLVLTRKQWRKAHRRWTVKEGTKCQLSQSNGRLNCSLRQDHP